MKITGSAQKYRVGRVSGNTAIFFVWPNTLILRKDAIAEVRPLDSVWLFGYLLMFTGLKALF